MTKMQPLATIPEASPEEALDRLRRFAGPVLVDLDETLYLRNSTEDFLDSARPALMAYALLRVLDLLRPWRWSGAGARDVWRVRTVMVLLPWTLLLWRRRVVDLAGRHMNGPLATALRARGTPPVIVTLGFRPVVTPLAAALVPGAPVVAARLWTTADRRNGKLAFATRSLGADAIRQAMVLTDSRQDLPLLASCACPLLTVWPEARFRPAFAGLYLPGRYLTQVKRPGAKYVRRVILQDDFALWLLASVWLAAVPVWHVLGLLALLLSFWAAYERGYMENDRIGAHFEADPKLSGAFGTTEVPTPRLAPWAWATAAGAVGLVLLRWPDPVAWTDALAWAAVLAATAAGFWAFNRLDKPSRVWPYGGLQLARCAAFATVVPMVPVAVAALGASVVEKWVPYILYRRFGRQDGWTGLPSQLLRLGLFVAFVGLIALQGGAQVFVEWPTLAFLAFFAFRARHELRGAILAVHRIDRPDPYAPSAAKCEPPGHHALGGAPP